MSNEYDYHDFIDWIWSAMDSLSSANDSILEAKETIEDIVKELIENGDVLDNIENASGEFNKENDYARVRKIKEDITLLLNAVESIHNEVIDIYDDYRGED